MTPNRVRCLVKRYGSVTAFSKAVPVSRRMATYWLADFKKLHQKWHARLREMEREIAAVAGRKP